MCSSVNDITGGQKKNNASLNCILEIKLQVQKDLLVEFSAKINYLLEVFISNHKLNANQVILSSRHTIGWENWTKMKF